MRQLEHDLNLSICISGRNDDYTVDFLYRLVTTLEVIAQSAEETGFTNNLEIVFVDWGSDVAISDVISLSDSARHLTRFVNVPKALISQAGYDAERFYTSVSMNAAIRRSRGRYVLLCGADVLFPPATLDALMRLLRRGRPLGTEASLMETFCLIGRYRLPWELVKRRISPSEWINYIAINAWQIPRDREQNPGFLYGAAGAIMCSRQLWDEARGLDESFSGWGWIDIDLHLRLSERYHWMELSSQGILAYDMDHSPNDKRTEAVCNENCHRINPQIRANNGPQWGISDVEVPHTASLNRVAPSKPMSSDWLSPVEAAHDVATLIASIQKTGAWSRDIACTDFRFLTAIRVLCGRLQPRRIVVLAASNGYEAFVLGCFAPHAEMILVDHWEDEWYPHGPENIGHALALPNVQYRGHMHILNCSSGAIGSKAEILAQLEDVDLIVGDLAGWEGMVGEQLLPKSSPMGTILYRGGPVLPELQGFNSFHRSPFCAQSKIDIDGLDDAFGRPLPMESSFEVSLRNQIWRRFRKDYPSGIYLYPGGNYTRDFLRSITIDRTEWPYIHAVLDDTPKPERFASDIDVVPFDSVVLTETDIVVVASDTIEGVLVDSLNSGSRVPEIVSLRQLHEDLSVVT